MSKALAYAVSLISVAVFSLMFITSLQKANPDRFLAIVSVLAMVSTSGNAQMAVLNSGKFDFSSRAEQSTPRGLLLIAPLIVGAFILFAGYLFSGIWKPVALIVIFAGAVAGARLGNNYLKGARS